MKDTVNEPNHTDNGTRIHWSSISEMEETIKNIDNEMDYSDLIEEMGQYTEAVLTRLDQDVYEEEWEFYALIEEDGGIKEFLGKGDDPIEAFKDAKD